MNKYPSSTHLEDKYKAARLSVRVKSARLHCYGICNKETPHYSQDRIGINGPVLVCRNCGSERTP
jgi:hypothetical protein